MAIELHDLKLLWKLRKNNPKGKNLIVLGDCLFHFSRSELARVCTTTLAGEDAKASLNDFSSAFGFDRVETIDIIGNPTIKADLGESIIPELQGQFDWVIDAGVLYWCFDVALVWKNILSLLSENAYVFHISALTGYFGRGYYALQPKLFTDFYKANCFEITYIGTRLRPPSLLTSKNKFFHRLKIIWMKITGKNKILEWKKLDENNLSTKDDFIPNNMLIACCAKRLRTVPFTKPTLSV